MIRAILFDLDGTLIDRETAHRRYCRDLFEGQPAAFPSGAKAPCLAPLLVPADRDRFAFAGRVAKMFPALGPPARIAADYALRLPELIVPDVAIVVLLKWLSDRYILGAVSNGSEAVQRAKIKAAGLSGLLDPVVISGSERAAKPHPSIFRKALALARVDPSEALFVGDDPRLDIAGAARVGITTCWVGGDRPYPEGIARPDFTIESVLDLAEVLP